jgi:hypothetical protein
MQREGDAPDHTAEQLTAHQLGVDDATGREGTHHARFDRLTKAASALLGRAVAAGEIRGYVSPEDLIRALVGMCYMHDQRGWQHTVRRLLDVFVDGLRLRDGKVGPSKKSAARKKKRSR